MEATDIQNQNLDLHIIAGDKDLDLLCSLFDDNDSDPSGTSMSITANKQSRDYDEDDEKSSACFGPQCGGSSSDSDSESDSDTPIVIDDDDQGLSYDDRIPISLAAPSTCSWEPSVRSDNESNSGGQIPPSPVLIENGGMTTEEWLVDEILKSMMVEDDDQEMRWYLVK
ncbi:hypothetical protein AJ78_08807 [Emergomyces pasteurianus Ep9510]|uniref:Uncharacterized protein n=1 Tax=Emergomyces pasteurianus Ep9510 TaxID=1447872 RepID=A0A1J9NZK2_9EURO|nr:hypothetical protein AJ78_08807 [Emergomyces pasteurianus Ep9510]